MTNKRQTLVRLVLFLLIAFSLTWIPHIVCIRLWGFRKWAESPFILIVTMTMFAPMLGNIITRLVTKEGFGDNMLHFNFKGSIRYYMIAFVMPIVFGIFISVIVNCTHGNWRFEELEGITFKEGFTMFMSLCITPIFYYSTCCFGEEFGWRAYMTGKLEELTGTAGAVVIGGVIWGLWHAVLVANGFDFGSRYPVLCVALMCVSCVFINAIMMWLTERTGSVFPAVLMHITIDAGMMNIVMSTMISGLSEETVRKVSELQSGILQMILPEAIVGTACFIMLMRDKKNKTESS